MLSNVGQIQATKIVKGRLQHTVESLGVEDEMQLYAILLMILVP
jgi:hypothetical protein